MLFLLVKRRTCFLNYFSEQRLQIKMQNDIKN